MSEKINENKYILFLENSGNDYKVISSENKKVIDFNGYSDAASPGKFNLPAKDIFLAIPQNTKPKITFTKISEDYLDMLPVLNPQIVYYKGGLAVQEVNNYIPKNLYTENYEVKGYLWINNNYCLHLRIHPYYILPSKRQTAIIKKFSIQLEFDNNVLPLSALVNNKGNGIFINPGFALNYESSPKYQLKRNDDWIDYNKTYLKIGTSSDDIYRISRSDLEDMGIAASQIVPQTFSFINKGKEIPIYVEGEEDGIFDENDFIEFVGIRNMGGNHRSVSEYGSPYNEYLGMYSDTTIYWLTWGGKNGLRVMTQNNINGSNGYEGLEYFNDVIHSEKNNWFDFSMSDIVRRQSPFYLENKTWHEGNISVGKSGTTFTLQDIYPDKPFYIFAKFQSYVTDINSKAHLVGLSLNSYPEVYDSTYIDKYQKVVLSVKLNSNLLTSGSNTVYINSFKTAATINLCIKDWVEIEYPRYLKTINDSLNFSFPFLTGSNTKNIKLSGVQGNNVVIWRYGNKYKKYSIIQNQDSVFVQDTVDNTSKFILRGEGKIKKPFYYYSQKFNNLRSSENSADYLAITHKKFIEKSNDYINFISGYYNVTATVIDVDDIYDEFSYGYFDPEAIKTFLESTHTFWKSPKPQYVVLIGSANYDYYGYKVKNFGLAPKYNYVPSYGVPVSDNWFVTWDTTGAYIPQMNIGRLPVETDEELDRYFQKHKEYVEQGFSDWNKTYLFFSGGQTDTPSELNLLKNTNSYILDNMVIPPPVGGIAAHFYKTIEPTTNFGPYTNEFFQEKIDSGAVFISYLGHSGTRTWDNTITEPEQLFNKNNTKPLITDFGCSTGKFAEPDVTSFSKLFVLADDGQAIAYIGNSSLGFVSTSTTVPQLFYENILKKGITNISEAIKNAKIELFKKYGSSGVNAVFALTNTLIGDPIISLPIPAKVNFKIAGNGIIYKTSPISDSIDSMAIQINYGNSGKVTGDTLTIKVTDRYNNSSFELNISKIVPLNSDSIIINIPVKNKPGIHNLNIMLDSDNGIEELSESDNEINVTYNVPSSSLKDNLLYTYENEINNFIRYLNPSVFSDNQVIELNISSDSNFLSFDKIEKPFDTLYTDVDLKNYKNNNRYWLRSRIKGEATYGISRSVKFGNGYDFSISDSIDLKNLELQNLVIHNNSVLLDTSKISFHILSAGFNDGNTVTILKNSVDYVKQTTLSGHHICVFDGATYEFKEYHRFNFDTDGQKAVDDYINLLDTLVVSDIIIIAVKNNGVVSSSELKERIRNLGSIYIDSLGFIGSWALIGKKGATQGTVPEAYSKANQGYVVIDTTIGSLFDEGKFLTTKIGPAADWKKLELKWGGNINDLELYPVGINTDNSLDTLSKIEIKEGIADLSNIKNYNYLRILGKINYDGGENESPKFTGLKVGYYTLPELATNYQVVSISKDSANVGENIELEFDVYNVGETTADSFYVTVDLVNENNTTQTNVFKELVTRIDSLSKKSFNISYNTVNLGGNYKFNIQIDTDDKILELYEDNNFYSIPFYVKPDTTKPTLTLTFDGQDIFDGEYISPNPSIKVELTDLSLVPFTDTSSVRLFLDNEPVYYSNNNKITYTVSSSNPKYTVEFIPELADGEHSISVLAKDASGNYAEQNGLSKSFVVSNQVKLLDLYNYPNPFSSDTYFTFKLTQIPDEVRIKVYTIAGRLVKEIRKTSAELKFDFNKIYWDGRDEDGDLLGNGVYIYRTVIEAAGVSEDITQKLAIVR